MARNPVEVPRVRITYERPSITFEEWREIDLRWLAFSEETVESLLEQCLSSLRSGVLDSDRAFKLVARIGELARPRPTLGVEQSDPGHARSDQLLGPVQEMARANSDAFTLAFNEGLETHLDKVWKNSLVSTFSPLARYSTFSNWEEFEHDVLMPIDELGFALDGGKLLGISVSESNKTKAERVDREFRSSFPKYLQLVDQCDRVPWIRIDIFPPEFWWRQEHPLPMFSGTQKPPPSWEDPFEDNSV